MTNPQETLYQLFADTHHLTFTSDRSPQITGIYRNHPVQIYLAGLAGQTSSRIILVINSQAGEPLIPEDKVKSVTHSHPLTNCPRIP